jgi:CRISPR type III-associated protein (TIGR04423 family)
MAQIWEEENDPLCENMPVMKLKKVVFAGFRKGDDK